MYFVIFLRATIEETAVDLCGGISPAVRRSKIRVAAAVTLKKACNFNIFMADLFLVFSACCTCIRIRGVLTDFAWAFNIYH